MLLFMLGYHVNAIAASHLDNFYIDAHCIHPDGRSPDWWRASRAVHSRYHHHLSDLPSLGYSVRVAMRIRRFYRHTPLLRPAQLCRAFAGVGDAQAFRARHICQSASKDGSGSFRLLFCGDLAWCSGQECPMAA